MYKVQSTKLTAELSRLTFFSRVSFKITIDFKSKPNTPRDMSQVMFTVEDLLTPSFLRHNINKIWSRYLLLKHVAFGQLSLLKHFRNHATYFWKSIFKDVPSMAIQYVVLFSRVFNQRCQIFEVSKLNFFSSWRDVVLNFCALLTAPFWSSLFWSTWSIKASRSSRRSLNRGGAWNYEEMED